MLPYCSQTYSNRKINQQYSNREIARLEEHTAIMHFFFALSLSFLIWWVTKISIVHLESYFSAALTYLMLRTMDCETFKNACWAKVQPFQAQPPKKSALGAALRSVQKAKTWVRKTWPKTEYRKIPISWQKWHIHCNIVFLYILLTELWLINVMMQYVLFECSSYL